MEVSFTTLLIGLPNSGKTTILKSIANDQEEIFPTAGFQITYITSNNKVVLVYDCSGQGWNRKNWNLLLSNSDAVIFVIDSQDADHFSIAKDTLMKFIQKNKTMKKKNLCIMLNKSEVKDRPEKQVLYKALQPQKIQKLVNKHYIKETSAYTKEGLEECFDWLYTNTNPSSSS